MNNQEYVTLDEAAETLKIKKGSLYYYFGKLGIEPKTFELNKHAYLTKEDVQRIRDVRERPWKLSEGKVKHENAVSAESATSQ